MNHIYTMNDFDFGTIHIGDLVSEEVVDYFMDELPPVTLRADCCQMGEPYAHRDDPETGRWRPTFATFKRVSPGEFTFCGYCFAGENEER